MEVLYTGLLCFPVPPVCCDTKLSWVVLWWCVLRYLWLGNLGSCRSSWSWMSSTGMCSAPGSDSVWPACRIACKSFMSQSCLSWKMQWERAASRHRGEPHQSWKLKCPQWKPSTYVISFFLRKLDWTKKCAQDDWKTRGKQNATSSWPGNREDFHHWYDQAFV